MAPDCWGGGARWTLGNRDRRGALVLDAMLQRFLWTSLLLACLVWLRRDMLASASGYAVCLQSVFRGLDSGWLPVCDTAFAFEKAGRKTV